MMPNLNNDDYSNRGLDLILHGGKKKQPKIFHIVYEKLVCLLKREVTIYFEFSIQTRKIQ
jgi:hypothetical protein